MESQILEIVKDLPIFYKKSQEQVNIKPIVEETVELKEGSEKDALVEEADKSKENSEKKDLVEEEKIVEPCIEIFPLVEGKKGKFLIKYGELKYLFSIEEKGVKRELDVWLKMTEKGLSTYRPDIYYIDPNFLFTISQFYEGYTSIDKINLSLVDKEIISRYLLQFNKDFHKITSNEYNLKAVIQNEFVDEIATFCKEGTLSEEETNVILSFVDQTDFGKGATYNHQELSMENILYNQETKDLKVIHMKQAKYGVPIYDYVYMLKTIDKEISQVFLPFIQKVNPKVIQAVSLLCDMKIYNKNKEKKANMQIDLENIYTQIGLLKEQISNFRK